MNQEEILQIMRITGVLQEGHFLLTSGRHSRQYMQCASVLQYAQYTARLCEELASRFADVQVDTVIGPAMGGVILAYEMGRALKCRAIFTERVDGKMCLRRGFTIEPGEKVLIAEDVVTTGGSVKEVIELVKEAGGDLQGVVSLVHRGDSSLDLGTRFEPLLQMNIESYTPEECPLCKAGMPINKPGSRRIANK